MKSKAAFNWLVALIIFSTPLLTLTVSHGGTGNYLLLMLLGMVTGWKQIRRFNRLETFFFTGLLLLFLVNVMSFSQTQNISGGYTWLGKYLYLFLGLFAYAVIKERFDFLVKHLDFFLIINSIAIGSIALYQYYYLNIPRVYGGTHIILFGNVAVVMLGLTLCRLFFAKPHWLMYLSAVFCLTGAILSQTRGAMIAIPVILLFLVIWSKGYQNKKLVIISLVSVTIIISSLFISDSPVRQRFVSMAKDFQGLMSDQEKIIKPFWRVEFWKNSLILFKENPVLGIGPGDYNVEMKALVESGQAINKSDMNYSWTPHSNFVNALVTSGSIGLFTFIFALFILPLFLIRLFRSTVNQPAYFMVILTSYFIFGITTTWIATNSAFSIFMVLLLFSLAYMNKKIEVPDESLKLDGR